MTTNVKNDDKVDAIILLTNSPSHTHYNIQDVNNFIILPYRYNKLKVFRERGKPVGFLTWAWFKEDQVDSLLHEGLIRESNYKCIGGEGLQLWGLDFVSTNGNARKMLREFSNEFAKVNGETTINFRRMYSPYKKHTLRIM